MENGTDNSSLSIGEVAERAGISRRTVRYYVQRNLIDPPEGRGRGSAYSEKHLEQIARIVRLQREGLALENIQRAVENGTEPETPRAPQRSAMLVMRVSIAPGIRLELDAGETLPEPDVLDELAAACERILRRNSASQSAR